MQDLTPQATSIRYSLVFQLSTLRALRAHYPGMPLMSRLFTLFLTVLVVGCVSSPERISETYSGPDAGQVALGIGAAQGTTYQSYTLLFRRTDGSGKVGRFTYFQDNIFSSQKRDYDTPTESGVVLLSSLPAGRYEIYDFDVFMNGGRYRQNFRSRAEFSIPFVVQPGKAVYLGNYQANGVRGRNIVGIPITAGAFFVVEDRLQQDVQLARARTNPIPVASQVESAVSSVVAIGSPFFVIRKP